MSDTIAVDGDTAYQNASALYQVAGELPASDNVRVVFGNSSEPPAANLTDHLRDRAGRLAAEIEKIRSYVASNSDALRKAVDTLRSTDELNASDAASMTSLIDMSTLTPPTTDGTAPGPSAPAGSSTPRSGFAESRNE